MLRFTYDPCLSCATHALGRMPLYVELVEGESGAVVDFLARDADGTVRNEAFRPPLGVG